jgi:hypothetical protein
MIYYSQQSGGAGQLESGSNHLKQVQDDQNDGNYDQNMDPTSCLREAWAYVPTEKAKQPQYY